SCVHKHCRILRFKNKNYQTKQQNSVKKKKNTKKTQPNFIISIYPQNSGSLFNIAG
uniref:Uncharacterized protein n=1 Tax=Ciona intestinalis TaxID=7719 RepID=F6R5N5_CIOIN